MTISTRELVNNNLHSAEALLPTLAAQTYREGGRVSVYVPRHRHIDMAAIKGSFDMAAQIPTKRKDTSVFVKEHDGAIRVIMAVEMQGQAPGSFGMMLGCAPLVIGNVLYFYPDTPSRLEDRVQLCNEIPRAAECPIGSDFSGLDEKATLVRVDASSFLYSIDQSEDNSLMSTYVKIVNQTKKDVDAILRGHFPSNDSFLSI